MSTICADAKGLVGVYWLRGWREGRLPGEWRSLESGRIMRP